MLKNKKASVGSPSLVVIVTLIIGLALLFILPTGTFLVAVKAEIKKSTSVSFDFSYDILPMLAKKGCSSAECHGAATGRGGFKLSLFGSYPHADYNAITRELKARRIDYRHPSNSLILSKPTQQIPHGGGRRFDAQDIAFKMLHQWIQDGAPYFRDEPKELTHLELVPKDGGYKVLATFQRSGRSIQYEVTQMALIKSTNDLVASVDDDGRVTPRGPGETWILARYGHLSARSSIVNPFQQITSKNGSLSTTHSLDHIWHKRLIKLGLASAPRAPDEILVRRLYLDLVGRPPAPDEVDRFFSIAESERIAVTADRLLSTDDFNTVFAHHLGDWFEVPIPEKDARNDKVVNAGLRRFFRQVVGDGDSISSVIDRIFTQKGPDQAWRRFSDPRDRAEFVGRSTLGLSIGCARCHNHPLDRWEQTEHLHFSAYFAEPRPNPSGEMMTGKFFQPETGRQIRPALLTLGKPQPEIVASSEERIARFILEGAKDQFCRNIVNRIFGALMGRYLVDPPTDHRLSNPPIDQEMLDLLTHIFQQNGTDLRELIRFIVTSELYAVASQPSVNVGSSTGSFQVSMDPQLQYMGRREARRLTNVQFRAAIEFVLGVSLGSSTDSRSLPESPLARQLYLLNSGLIQEGLQKPGNQIDAIFEFETNPTDWLNELTMLILSRQPRSTEKNVFIPLLEKSTDPQTTVRDLAFALIVSREFGSLR